MDIGSMGRMQPGFQMGGMGGMRPPQGDPAKHAEEMSARLLEQQDADGDGLLSTEEFSIDSDKFAKIDEDGDGFLSQAELQVGAEAKMAEMKARFESEGMNGMMPPADMATMQQMQAMGGGMGNQAMASEAYGTMQASMFGASQNASAYSDQLLLEQLSVTV